MKLDLNKKFTQLKGLTLDENSKDLTMAEVLAVHLGSYDTKLINVVKGCGWAEKLQKEGEIEIDKADKKALNDFVENEMRTLRHYRFQILTEIENCKGE